MWRVVAVMLAVVAGVVLGSAAFVFSGCGRPPEIPPPEDELSGPAAAVPPGKVKVLLTRKPDALPPGAREARYEWAVLASLQDDKLGELTPELKRQAAGQGGWAVVRYALTVKLVGDAHAEAVRDDEWVKPK